jgi:hypothetical protein
MFYYIEVHLLDHYTQSIKMHGETVKFKKYYSVSQSTRSRNAQPVGLPTVCLGR